MRERWIRLTTLSVAVLVTAWFLFSSQIEGQVLGIVFFSLVVWSLYPEHHLESSILVIGLLTFFQISLSLRDFIDSIFSTYGGSGLWTILAGFVLAKGIEESGLARRISLLILSAAKGRPRWILGSVVLASLAVSPLSPSTTAKAFLLLPVFMGLVESYGVDGERSNFGVSLMLLAMAGNNICSAAFLTATVPNPISAQYIEEVAAVRLGWLDWLVMGLPISVLTLGISWLLSLLMHPPEARRSEDLARRIDEMRDAQGPVSSAERNVAILFSISLALWMTDGLHPYNSGIASLLLTLLLFVPGLGSIPLTGFSSKVPWGSISLFAASMFLAKAVGEYDALAPVARGVFEALNLSSLEPGWFTVVVVSTAMLMHIAFTSTTVYATVMVPLAISLAELQTISPEALAIPVAFLTPIAIILPINTIPNIVFYGAGYFSQRQMVSYGLLLSLASVLIVLLIGLPYWSLVGIL